MYGVSKLHNLVTLNLANNGILTIEGIKDMTNLQTLCLAGNNIKVQFNSVAVIYFYNFIVTYCIMMYYSLLNIYTQIPSWSIWICRKIVSAIFQTSLIYEI